MRKENKKGITLISLVITIMVLIILSAITTYSGINVIQNAKFTSFTNNMKTMQLQINLIYEKYKKGETISIDGNKKEISEIGDVDTSEITARKDEIFTELQTVQESGIDQNEKDNYKFWSNELIKKLGIEEVEGSFFVNIAKRSFISYEGIEYMGESYYTLNQLPDNLYNVEYEGAL